MMVVDNKYEIGNTVYLKTDPEQLQRIVYGIQLFRGGELLYMLASGTITSNHYEFEISEAENVIIKTK